ncbi:MAG: gliding motility lipoprotein GldB, partial [Bacteroidetes bacterium]|nr:gliding motility lipoprotein GldB [Bacteroidota bacterium]
KRLYLQDAILPATPDRLKIGYTQEQYNWIKKNEVQVWGTIIENHMLYSNDGRIIRVFTSDGPFTAEFSKTSPPLLGNWIGWQIVKQYMERNPDISIEQLLKEKDSQKILAGSKYKPEK